ncbi:hypothetical protein KGA66_24420 [Actinocrinis puniceicyclus]|uniref:Uncharacterized protein n=1 Tax=Actinocrinis puniceicyclus TaxID=977794 RepID=A0A8J7WUH9_9ACTN|nr:hypothetical protein [Actinocrinis puniceicyclus]MBS2966212.1 hypothetical protein [Actinocrinis puniceicyclus]
MSKSRREAVNARDEAIERIGRATRWIGGAAAAGALVAAAGFAHLIPTQLPHLNVGDSTSSSSSGSSGTTDGTGTSGGGAGQSQTGTSSGSGNSSSANGSGLQPPNNAPAGGSGQSQVTSGGS